MGSQVVIERGRSRLSGSFIAMVRDGSRTHHLQVS